MIDFKKIKASHGKFLVSLLYFLLLLMLIFQPGRYKVHAAAVSETATLIDRLKYESVSVRVENLPVANLLRSIGKRAGINIIVAEDVKTGETITLDLQETTLYNLFQIIIDSKSLQYAEKNNVVRVGKVQTRPIVTANLCPSNSDAAELLDQLKPLLSADGIITVSEKSNCYIIQDYEEQIQRVQEMLTMLDLPVSQVHIKASIVKVTQEAKRQLGIQWDLQNYASATEQASKSLTGSVFSATSINPPTDNLGIVLGYIDAGFNLDIALNALQEDNLALVLSSPQILVKNGKSALIKQGTEVAFVSEAEDGVSSTTFKEANLSLEVNPKIQGKLISIELTVNNDSVGRTINQVASLDSQEIKTDLLLRDGVTAVIGGIILKSDDNNKDSVPGLSKIPILGYLFRNSSKENRRDELLVFITANIISFGQELPIAEKTDNFLKEQTQSKLLSGEEMELSPMKLLKK